MFAVVTTASCAALVLFLFPLAYSPGPGNAFFAGIGASQGVRAAMPALAGYHIATFVATVLIGFGLGAVVLRQPAVAKTLAALGSAYVLWLAWQFFRSAQTQGASDHDAPTGDIGFWSGAVVLLLNPKAYSIIAVMFAQFLQPLLHGDIAAVLTITVIFTSNNLIAFVVWTFAGRGLAALFRGGKSKKWIDYAFAAILMGVALWMALPLFDS